MYVIYLCVNSEGKVEIIPNAARELIILYFYFKWDASPGPPTVAQEAGIKVKIHKEGLVAVFNKSPNKL